MNYYEWSNEYYETAQELNNVINRFKSQRKNACKSERKELDAKIAKYREYYCDCIHIANHLMQRYSGAAE